MTNQWELAGEKLAQALQGLEDEQEIRTLCLDVVGKINAVYSSNNSKKAPMTTIRKIIQAAFPSSDSKQNNAQYFTESGKGKIKRYQHLALKYLTFSKEFWDSLGNDARQE